MGSEMAQDGRRPEEPRRHETQRGALEERRDAAVGAQRLLLGGVLGSGRQEVKHGR